MRRWAVVAITLAGLATGCTTAQPERWILYARANYLQGLLEAKGTTLCAERNLSPSAVDFCTTGKTILTEVNLTKPQIEAELSKKEPDWAKIMKYVDLVFALAAKVPIP